MLAFSFRGWRGSRRGYTRGHDRGEGSGGHSGRGRGHGPPPGLKGREIGMWYARRGKVRKEEKELAERQFVPLDDHREQHIRRLLHDIQTSESVPPQPQRSYKDITSDCSKSYSGSFPQGTTRSSKPEVADHRSVPDSWWDDKEDMELLADSDKTQSQSSIKREDVQTAAIESQHKAETSEMKTENQEDVDMEADSEISKVYRFIKDEDFIPLNTGSEDIEMDQFTITRDPYIDQKLLKDIEESRQSSRYQRMLEFRKKLPSFSMREKILEVVCGSQVTVISGETGCGKTTQVAQFILDDFIDKGKGSACHVVCTQPRRISAVSVAERVADERAEACGNKNSVGYQIRLESKMPRAQGSILYCTTGILLKWLESDPLLLRASHIVLDEIHERDLLSDFLIIILKDILPRRSDLKLVLMSATLNAEMFSQYFGNCPMLNIPGFTYPVQELYLEDILEVTSYQPNMASQPQRRSYSRKAREMRLQEDDEKMELEDWFYSLKGNYSFSTLEALMNMDYKKIDLDLIMTLIDHICTHKGDGAILIFVPGWDEISKLNDQLSRSPKYCSDWFCIIPLHSLMPTANQRKVFDRPPQGVRKIVIATNIAETSITIDDVVYVIDCGKIKVKNFVPESNLTTLEPHWVSVANARQRRGRAGRVQPGECYHMFTRLKLSQMEEYLKPEILRTRLEEICLQIKLLKLGKIEPFISKALEPPSMEALHSALINLEELNALDHEENLLPLGYHLARMPVDPHVGKMILFGAMFCCLDPVLTVAASLGFKDAFTIPLGKEKEADRRRKELSKDSKSDHILLINAFQGWERAKSRGTDRQYCWDNFLSANTLRMLGDMKKQFMELLKDLGFVNSRSPKEETSNINSGNYGLIKAVICAGLYPNVAKISKSPNPHSKGFRPTLFCTKTDRRVTLHPKSVNANEKVFESKWFIFHQKLKTNSINLHDCSMVAPYPLLFFGGDIDIRRDREQDCVAVDDWILFRASPSIAKLVIDLRRELDRVLEEKISKPGPTTWDKKTKEGAVMRAIVDLISMEDDLYLQGGSSGGGANWR
ncbi:ATP-dependent DNA/RNA helicase DHX36-like [Liolophura sinensis]|uniref:ATP-dependent DNA/RNA helicase DHX36-like n=1 Tax=Liolophura sinensis TaxID=3198878 RepID=UPI00315837B6